MKSTSEFDALVPGPQEGRIVVLGSLDTADGELSRIGKDRCDRARVELNRRPGWRLLLTRGFREHFNTSPRPHVDYLKAYPTHSNTRGLNLESQERHEQESLVTLRQEDETRG